MYSQFQLEEHAKSETQAIISLFSLLFFVFPQCMKAYVEFEITEGAYEISCPDALCPAQGVLTVETEITGLVSASLLEKHQRYRLNRGECRPQRQTRDPIHFSLVNNGAFVHWCIHGAATADRPKRPKRRASAVHSVRFMTNSVLRIFYQSIK